MHESINLILNNSGGQCLASFASLQQDEVHIWQVDLRKHQPSLLYPTLSTEEKLKAQRYSRAHHENRFVIVRSILRQLLADYLNQSPQRIEFSYTIHGKPLVEGIQFNVSHSQERALIAIARSEFVGIDIEYKRPIQNVSSLCARFFSQVECETICARPQIEWLPAFFDLWVRKEASAKALGMPLFALLAAQKEGNSLKQCELPIIYSAACPLYASALASSSIIKTVHLFNYLGKKVND